MTDHGGQPASAREMIRAHLYPACAAICTATFVWVAIPVASTFRAVNTCIKVTSTGNRVIFNGGGPHALTPEVAKELGYTGDELSVAKALESCLAVGDKD